ncbi:metallophosphoesterase family protein [Dictyoglomus sp.]|jgi:3',5'-cyclic AMP phosphodiesterase CpdA|uniref:metallophosphoesterase family protein n=1 Tax=Dictyoglomus sp. TaxID=28205 RepID=UPI000CCF5F6F|nr:MAG: hypothetical protein C0196_02360 [Dictyoglomus turgidum]
MRNTSKILAIIFLFISLYSTIYAFTFAVIGDRAGRPVFGVFERNLSEVVKRKPDFIVQLGDILVESSDEEYRYVGSILKNVSVPFYIVPGNHDLYKDPKGARFQSFTKRPLYYYFDYENARFIILNNASGSLGKVQLEWLIEVLKGTNKKYKFVFMHQPVISPSWFFLFHKADPVESKILMKLFEEYHVNYVFSGHIHMYYRKEINGVVYIISGIGGARPYISSDLDEGKPHFILIKVSDEGINEEVVRLNW